MYIFFINLCLLTRKHFKMFKVHEYIAPWQTTSWQNSKNKFTGAKTYSLKLIKYHSKLTNDSKKTVIKKKKKVYVCLYVHLCIYICIYVQYVQYALCTAFKHSYLKSARCAK